MLGSKTSAVLVESPSVSSSFLSVKLSVLGSDSRLAVLVSVLGFRRDVSQQGRHQDGGIRVAKSSIKVNVAVSIEDPSVAREVRCVDIEDRRKV